MKTKQNAHVQARVKVQTPLYVHLVGGLALVAMLYLPGWIMSTSLKMPVSVSAQYAQGR